MREKTTFNFNVKDMYTFCKGLKDKIVYIYLKQPPANSTLCHWHEYHRLEVD